MKLLHQSFLVWMLVVAGMPAAAVADDWWVVAQGIDAASQCDSLDSVPITFLTSQIDYQSAIQGIFDNNCTACHTDSNGPPVPGGLSLDPGVSWSNLVNLPSSQNSSIYRVVPGRPDLSLLFHKVNCAVPGVGARMPYGGPYLSLDDQALIYDWISAGAPPTTTDVIFLSGFDLRG